jgi:hypothetical protein
MLLLAVAEEPQCRPKQTTTVFDVVNENLQMGRAGAASALVLSGDFERTHAMKNMR